MGMNVFSKIVLIVQMEPKNKVINKNAFIVSDT